MIVGIDAKCLSRTKTGIGTYLVEMLTRLATNLYDSKIRVILYSNKKIDAPFILPNNWIIKTYRCKVGTLGVRFKLRSLLIKDKVNIFWGPDHVIPVKSKFYKTILTVHDLSSFIFPRMTTVKNRLLLKAFLKPCCKEANIILADSNSTKKDLVHIFKIDEGKIKVCYVGEMESKASIDLKPIERFNLKNKKYLLFVGTIEPKKNLANIIHAFELIKENSLYLVLAGGLGWKFKPILKAIKRSKKRNKIILTNRISDLERDSLYSNCELVLFPSYYEGFGFPILEGYSYNKLVITGRNSSLVEVAGPNGIFVNDVNNPKEIAQKIDDVEKWTGSEKKKAISECKKWGKQFSRNACAKAILDSIKGLSE